MTNTRTTITAALTWLFLSPIAQATDGPSAVISQPIPHDLVLTYHTGTPQIFKMLKGGRGAALSFTRPLDW